MAEAPEINYFGKEAVRNPLQDSYGPEVDGRGLEAVRPAEPEPRPSFWRRRRLPIVIAVALLIVGAVVGGAVGGTLAKGHHNGGTTSASTSTASPSQTGTLQYPRAMSGTAAPQVKSLPTAIPGTFSDQEGAITVYITGSDFQTYRKTYYNETWNPDFKLVISEGFQDIVPVTSSPDRLELLVRTTSYEVVPLVGNLSSSDTAGTYQFTLSTTGWARGNYGTSGVEVVYTTTNGTMAFASIIGFDGILYYSGWQNTSSLSGTISDGWSDWLWFGSDDNATTDWYNYTPTVSVSWTYQNNQFQPLWDVFGVRKLDNAIWHRAFRDGYWSPAFVSRGGFCTGRPVVVDIGNGPVFDMLILVRGGDARLWYSAYNRTAALGEFQPLGEITLVGEPEVVHNDQDTQITVFVCSADHEIRYTSFNIASGEWSGSWSSLGGDFESSPKGISTIPGRIDLFLVGQAGQLMWQRRIENGLQWLDDWSDLGTPP